VKRLSTFLVAAALALGALALPAAARAEGGDNAAVAVNTKDGSSLFKLAFSIRHVMSDVVDQTNAAVAYSSCNSCTTVAIAIEIVLVENNPSVVDPTNVAIAVNYQCTLCATFAAAYQFVVSTNGPAHFTAEGNRELAEIHKELEDLQKEDLTLDQLVAKLDEIKARLVNVLRTQLVSVGDKRDEKSSQDETQTAPSSTQPTTTEPPPTDTTTTPTTGTDETTTTSPTTTDTTTTGP
jgi:putative peptide zinc metalloprotease protein